MVGALRITPRIIFFVKLKILKKTNIITIMNGLLKYLPTRGYSLLKLCRLATRWFGLVWKYGLVQPIIGLLKYLPTAWRQPLNIAPATAAVVLTTFKIIPWLRLKLL